MTASAARPRRRSLTGYAKLLLALTFLGGGYAVFAPSGQATGTAPEQSLAIREGRALFLTGCSSCHGLNAQGGAEAPSLIGVGSAAVQFQVGTGRMPLAANGPQAERKKVQYTPEQIDQMAAYIGSLAPGPSIPEGDLTDGDLQEGGELFATNCASCHNFAGSGGALTYGKYAPSLGPATPEQVYAAMLTGPESMPVFSDSQLTPAEKRSIVRYVEFVTEHKDYGGHGLGRYGPVPEGLVSWLVGIGALVAITFWIGARA